MQQLLHLQLRPTICDHSCQASETNLHFPLSLSQQSSFHFHATFNLRKDSRPCRTIFTWLMATMEYYCFLITIGSGIKKKKNKKRMCILSCGDHLIHSPCIRCATRSTLPYVPFPSSRMCSYCLATSAADKEAMVRDCMSSTGTPP